MYTSDFFYSHRWEKTNNRKLNTYQVDRVDIQSIQSLKSHISDESGYYNHMLQWRISDNEHLTEKELNQLYPAMQFIVMSATINKDFITKNKIKNHHIALLRRLYLDWDDYGDDSCITMGFKRPFGNSHVYGDVREEMVRHGDKAALDRDLNDNDDWTYEIEALEEFVIFLDKLLKEAAFELKINCFKQKNFSGKYSSESTEWINYLDNNFRLHSYLYDWEPDISEIREEKITTLLNN